MSAFNPRPVRTACSTQNSLITGNMPGMAASTKDTFEFGSLPNCVDAPENSFAFEATWACTSIPMTNSQSYFAPQLPWVLGPHRSDPAYHIHLLITFWMGVTNDCVNCNLFCHQVSRYRRRLAIISAAITPPYNFCVGMWSVCSAGLIKAAVSYHVSG